MKRRCNFRPMLAIMLLTSAASAAFSANAQTWDTFLPQPDTQNAGCQVIIDPFSVDPANPALFLGSDGGAILRMQPQDATTYNFTTTLVENSLSGLGRMGVHDAASTLYAVGKRPLVGTPPFPRANPLVWTVRKSAFDPLSGTWGTWTDDGASFYLSAKESSMANGFATDVSGNVFVSGSALLKNYPHWIVRCKSAGGGWTTISDIAAKSSASAYGLCYYPGVPSRNLPSALFAVGILDNKWTVQRLDGNGWMTVDAGPLNGAACTVTYDNNGHLYVVGYRVGGLAGFAYGWVVRRSTAGGAPGSWTTVLDVSEGYFSGASTVAADRDGNIWVSGHTGTTMNIKTTQPTWTVVRNSPGQSWSDSWNLRQHQFGNAANSRARGIATDAYGHVFIVGHVTDWTDGNTSLAGQHIALQRLVP